VVRVRISAEGLVQGAPELVYRLLADYRQHHPRILPAAFSNLVVERGGVGTGTVITFDLCLMGRTFRSRSSVTEPEPGRVLEESDGRIRTRFSVDREGNNSRVSIDSEYESVGLQGLAERWLVPRMLGKLYREELRLLDVYAREQAAHAGA
jgi:hypothetical protein